MPRFAGTVEESPSAVLPITAVFALTEKVGKTALMASLGRTFAECGESVLLVDTDAGSPLPRYFSLPALLPGEERMISPVAGNGEGTISLASYDLDTVAMNPERQQALADKLLRSVAHGNRVLLELSERTAWFLRVLARPGMGVLIPIEPTMSSVISLQTVERFFRDLRDPSEPAVLPRYVVSKFDAANPLHRDVRDFLGRQLGERLLPLTVRWSSAIEQALGQGMTVAEYALRSPVEEDYRAVARWLREAAPPVVSRIVSRNACTRWRGSGAVGVLYTSNAKPVDGAEDYS